MGQQRNETVHVRISLRALTWESPKTIPVAGDAHRLAPFEQLQILDCRNTLAHPAENLGAEAFDPWLNRPQSRSLHRAQVMFCEVSLDFIIQVEPGITRANSGSSSV